MVTKLSGKTWYYPACRTCLSRFLTNKPFKCTRIGCKGTSFDNMYKVCLICSDGTCELEFVIFYQRAQLLIGKPLHVLEKKYDRFDTPPEIENLVGQKFTFIVRFSTKRSIENAVPSFEVIRTKHQHSKQSDAPSLQITQGRHSSIAESSIRTNRKPLIPIKSIEIPKQDTPKTSMQDDTEIDPMDIEDSDDNNKNDISRTKRLVTDNQGPTIVKRQRQ